MSRYRDRESAKKFEEILTRVKKVAIVTHYNPDGDAVGSAVALSLWLQKRSIGCRVIIPNRYPQFLSFLDREQKILFFDVDKEAATEAIEEAELIVMVDLNQLSRLENIEPLIEASTAQKVLIDHHLYVQMEGLELLIHNVKSSSTCELIYWLMVEMEAEIDLAIANSLYVGMMTDTNNFNNSVEPDTLLMASHLLSIGVDKEHLQHLVFDSFSENRMRLMGYMLLEKLVLLKEYRLGYMILSMEDQQRFNYSAGDSEGFVNLPLKIKGVEIAILFTQLEESIRVSLRSAEGYSVESFAAKYFGGGGHKRASGGTLYMPIENVESHLLSSLQEGFKLCKDE